MLIHKHIWKKLIVIKMPYHTLAGKKNKNPYSDMKQ